MAKQNKKEKTLHDVPVPAGVSQKMVEVAKDYVTSRLQDGFTMEGLFKRNGMSSKTYYQWLEVPEYQDYINELSDTLIDEDELVQVRKMKKKILAFADKTNVTAPEMKMFMETFQYIFEADARLQAEKLGLTKHTDGGSGSGSGKTVEERKALLLSKLKG